MGSAAYAAAGVDPSKINGFKEIMKAYGRQTLEFPRIRRNVNVINLHAAHGAAYEYLGNNEVIWVSTTEGLGNKNWIAEWMYKFAGTGLTYYDGIGKDNMRMAVNDNIAHGAMPAVYQDEAAAGTSEWFADDKRSHALGKSFFEGCEEDGIALAAGESPALRYLVKAMEPVDAAPVLSGNIIGLVPADKLITGEHLCPGSRIIGVTSSGLHANGISLVIQKALELPHSFLTKLPNGRTLGEEALIPTRSYVGLVEALMQTDIYIRAFLPGTGDGVAKLAVDKRPMTYHIHSWLLPEKIPPLFRFLHECCGVSLIDCLCTFNWGMGYYIFVAPAHVEETIAVGTKAGYELMEIGEVKEGPRQTIFEPAGNLILPASSE